MTGRSRHDESRSSSGQDAALSRRQPEFDSPSGHEPELLVERDKGETGEPGTGGCVSGTDGKRDEAAAPLPDATFASRSASRSRHDELRAPQSWCGTNDCPPDDRCDVCALVAALAAAEARAGELEREGFGKEPNDQGGPGHEETYWLRRKLQASIRHLRDVEDYYRLRGGSPEGFNMIRAGRARDLYEAITEDFVYGKTTRETRAELAARADKATQALATVRAECDLPEHIAAIVGEVLA